MLDIRWVRENPDALDRALAARGLEPAAATLIALDEKRRAAIARVQALQEERNAASKEIGRAKAAKDEARAAELIAAVAKLKDDVQAGEDEERRAMAELEKALALIPNMPLPDVPVGPDESANREVKVVGEAPAFEFPPKEHFELGEALGGMDFETAAKLSGSRFVVLQGQLARLHRALGQFMIDVHTQEHGYMEVAPPLMVWDDVLYGTGQLPKFEDDQFVALSERELWREAVWVRVINRAAAEGVDLTRYDLRQRMFEEEKHKEQKYTRLWLIPTAEVPLTNLVREEILDEAALPMRVTALTPCFRSEAGSAGRDTRGMLRQHQFDKVELVSITTPEASAQELERMLACAETVLRRLGLHYRVVVLSTGDMGFAAQKTYDIEVWLSGQGAYREISSCSLCGDFQARRMNARYRPAEGKGPRFVHTLNGSGVAVGRALIAVMETYQRADGTIDVPEALAPYMGGITRIGRG